MKTDTKVVDINAKVLSLTANVFLKGDETEVRISFKNCSYGTIKAIKFIVKGYNSFSENVIVDGKDSFLILFQDLSVQPLEVVNDLVAVLPDKEIRKVECVPYQICYEDDSIVDVEKPNIIEYRIERLQMIGDEQNEEISEKEQLRYLRKVNERATCYPQSMKQGWICVCGQLNKKQNEKCMNCGDERAKLFDCCNQPYVLTQCEQERKQNKVEKQKRRQKRKLFAICCMIITVFMALTIVLWRENYVRTYGMDEATYKQWKNALQEYENWKEDVYELYYGANHGEGKDGFHDIIVEHYGGEDNYYSSDRQEINVKKYTYSELLTMDTLNEKREAVLDKVGQIEQLTNLFPQKYQEIFERLCEYQKLYYIMDMDLDSSKMAENYLWGTYKKKRELDEDISRIEEYLQDKYLDLETVDLSTDVNMSYKPKTFSYSYSSGEDYSTTTMSSDDLSKAKEVADDYCQMLVNKQSSIDKITYTGTNSTSGNYAHFEYKLKYSDGITRTGIVTIDKSGDSFEATGMNLD